MWTPNGAVLIDPAAHGGHRETDLAMLELCTSTQSTTAIRACTHYMRAGASASVVGS